MVFSEAYGFGTCLIRVHPCHPWSNLFSLGDLCALCGKFLSPFPIEIYQSIPARYGIPRMGKSYVRSEEMEGEWEALWLVIGPRAPTINELL